MTKILVVDDNRDTIRVYSKAILKKYPSFAEKSLQGIPLSLDSAEDVESGLEKVAKENFDILIVDLKIPGLNKEEFGGLELIDYALSIDPLRPIIVITGYGSINLVKKTLTRGVFDFIEKSPTAIDDLIDAVKRSFDYLEQKVTRTGNPFTPMTGMDPSVFGGRMQELGFFEQKLMRVINTKFREHFLVLGDWGMGKSTLMKEYKKISQTRGYIASLVPLEPISESTTMLEIATSLINGIIRDLPYPVSRFTEFLSYLDSFGVSVLGSGLQISRNTAEKDISPQSFLHDTLLKLWKGLDGKTKALILLLDDLDNYSNIPEFIMLLKQTLSMSTIRDTGILMGISSTTKNWIKLTSSERHHPLARFFINRVELTYLSKEEQKETILKSSIPSGVLFDSDVLDLIYDYTRGHPFEMQVLCYHLFDNQVSRKVNIDVWEKSLQEAIKDMGLAIFRNWSISLNRDEKLVLQLIAKKNVLTNKELQKEIDDIDAIDLLKILTELVSKGLIFEKKRNTYSVDDPMFKYYLTI